jgi:hypothetical protein
MGWTYSSDMETGSFTEFFLGNFFTDQEYHRIISKCISENWVVGRELA